MLYLLASNSLNRWGYNILKLMVISSWSSAKSRVNMRSTMKTSYFIIMQPFSWLIYWRLLHQSCITLQNTKVDALAALAATLPLPADTRYHLTVATRHLFCLKYSLEISEVHTTSINFEPRDWWFPITDYALHNILPDDPTEAVSVRWRFTRFYYDVVVKTLYCRSYDGVLIRCLSNSEAQEIIKEAHDDICRAHQPGPKTRIDCTDLAIIGRLWSPMQSNTQKSVRLVKSMQILYANPRNCSIPQSQHGHLKLGESI